MTNQFNPLTEQEVRHLDELRMISQTIRTPGWGIIVRKMQEDADEAHEDIIGAAYATDTALAGLTRRWQQRESVVRSLKNYVQSCEDEIRLLLEESNQKGSVPLDAERYQEAG